MIKSPNHTKAIGPNSIPAKVSKLFDKTINVPLADFINLLLKCGIFPMSLKVRSEKGDFLDWNY